MKANHIKYLLVLGTGALIVSCSSDFLETEPTSVVSGDRQNEILLEKPEMLASIISGAYTTVYSGDPYMSSSQDDWGMSSYKIATDVMCDDIAFFINSGGFALDQQLSFREPDYRRPVSMWRQFYHIVSSANSVIKVLKDVEGTNNDLDAMLGQAYALRGWAYYWLINMWQQPYDANPDALGVPLILEEESESISGRAPVKTVYARIDTDLSKACDLLKGKQLGNTAINEYAASGIYANVLMFLGRYDEAATRAEYATKGGTLAGADELLAGMNSVSMSEVIWGYAVTEEWNLVYGSFMSHMNPYVDGYAPPGYFPKLGASALVDKIDANDIRKGWFGYSETLNTNKFDFSQIQTAGFAAYVPNKFLCPNSFLCDLIYMRVAEMYFVAAEAHYLNKDEANARKWLTDVMSTRITGYDASGKSGDALYEEICFQKRVETWGEGCRIFDAKRRNETIDRTKSTNFAASLASTDAMTYSARDYRMIYKIPTLEMENNTEISSDQQNP